VIDLVYHVLLLKSYLIGFFCFHNVSKSYVLYFRYSQTWAHDHLRIATTILESRLSLLEDKRPSEKRPPVNNGHYFWVVVHRFDCIFKEYKKKLCKPHVFLWPDLNCYTSFGSFVHHIFSRIGFQLNFLNNFLTNYFISCWLMLIRRSIHQRYWPLE
jgi:hypothetical protein